MKILWWTLEKGTVLVHRITTHLSVLGVGTVLG